MLDTIKGEIKIFTKEVEGKKGTRIIFNACVGATKTEDGYINYYMPVNFATALKKDVAKVYKNGSFDVVIKEAWIKAYKDREDNTRPILFVNKALIVSEDEPVKKKQTKTKNTKSKKVDDPVDEDEDETDDLPF